MLMFFILVSVHSFAQSKLTNEKTGMLILGSDDLKTLEERVNIGYKLYASTIDFDYIIVSGGCGAHKSKICEASKMAALLIEKGVPAEKIFKEEKSKNTVQNYVYSRILRKKDGTKVINPNDSLYVVSNHWHAISVAARFTTYDGVHARYHIEGSILPSTNDKVDYTDIYNKNSDNEDYSRLALWPLINASYSLEGRGNSKNEGKTFGFIGDTVYQGTSENLSKGSARVISESISGLPGDWHKEIDAAFYNASEDKVYLFKGTNYLRFTPNSKSVDPGYPKPINNLVKNLPEDWHNGFIDAAFFNPTRNELFLFKGDEYLKVSASNRKVNEGFPNKITSFVTNWPFVWGSGDIDAAHYNKMENKIYLFRGKEYLKMTLEGKVEPGYPQNIKIK